MEHAIAPLTTATMDQRVLLLERRVGQVGTKLDELCERFSKLEYALDKVCARLAEGSST